MKDFALVLSVQFALVGLISLFAVSDFTTKIDGRDNPQYAVFFPLGTSAADAVSHVVSAGGSVVRFAAFDNLIIVSSIEKDARKRLKESGALFIFSPFIKGNCVIEDKTGFNVSQSV